MPRSWVRASDFRVSIGTVKSGTSNTIAFSEGLIGTEGPSQTYRDTVASGIAGYYWNNPGTCRAVAKGQSVFFAADQTYTNLPHFLGRSIWDNRPLAYAFYSLLPPNSPSCSNNPDNGWVSVSSAHTRGVVVSFLDGSVRFIPNSINTDHWDWSVTQNPLTTVCAVHDVRYPGGGTPAYPNNGTGTFSYGVWAELGAVNSIAAIPSL